MMRRLNLMTRALFFLLLAIAPASAQVNIFKVADKTVTSAATLIDNTFLRYALSCTNHSTTVNARWGGSDVTATAGQRVPAGATIEIKNMQAVYMISEGANVTVSCTGETR